MQETTVNSLRQQLTTALTQNRILRLRLDKEKQNNAVVKKRLLRAQKRASKRKRNAEISKTCQMENEQNASTDVRCEVTADLPQETIEIVTRDEDRRFIPSVKACTVELMASEVSSSNVAPVIRAVLRHLVGVDVPLGQLPSKQTAVNFSDAAQFLMQVMYKEKIEESSNFGIKKDGTSRDKKKIITSSITLDSGEELPLGYNFVAKETGETIADYVKGRLNEIEMSGSSSGPAEEGEAEEVDSNFFTRMLQKLSYFMSDRAANEGKADNLLRDWREKMLEDAGEKETSYVHSFHCMAHALLGFLYHSKAFLQEQHKQYKVDEIHLGREGHQQFSNWRFEFPPQRCVRKACSLMGP
ncbi:uncharacterized protein [Littorina saxatilis]|uniref:uncharacterized protein n=1 Tax=Littorina saxatilis TaxID=31220 RepID=UPI0038B46819